MKQMPATRFFTIYLSRNYDFLKYVYIVLYRVRKRRHSMYSDKHFSIHFYNVVLLEKLDKVSSSFYGESKDDFLEATFVWDSEKKRRTVVCVVDPLDFVAALRK